MRNTIRTGPFAPLDEVFFPLSTVPDWTPDVTQVSRLGGNTLGIVMPDGSRGLVTLDAQAHVVSSKVGAKRMRLTFDRVLSGESASALMSSVDPALYPGLSIQQVSSW